jgi:thioredoxin-dependent peroxiredoxin
MIAEGKKAPANFVIDSEGKPASLKDYLGKTVVLYFYPKDNTTGCTIEAEEFRDWNKDISKLGAVVIGVSKDTPQSHQKFTKKYKINFPLWSDEKLTLLKAFGVWQKKKLYGREFMGTVRSTFVINKKGIIEKVFPKVTPRVHGKEIYDYLKENK